VFHSQPDDQIKDVSLNPALATVICATLLYAISWVLGCSGSGSALKDSGGGKKLSESRELIRPALEGSDDKLVAANSGRRLTIERMSQRAATSLEFSNPEYGIAFDAPKGYLLKEGDLPQMDRGLGYLGPVPMHFAESGGVRLATVEAPAGLYTGTNFVNEFFTVSAVYGTTATSCAALDIASEARGAAVTRSVDTIAFHGFEEHSVASLHQYTGIYLHGYANETCYEIGYGVATVGAEGSGSLKRLDPGKLLARLEKILASVRIAPPDFERFTATE
jgi:hypothetical protein